MLRLTVATFSLETFAKRLDSNEILASSARYDSAAALPVGGTDSPTAEHIK